MEDVELLIVEGDDLTLIEKFGSTFTVSLPSPDIVIAESKPFLTFTTYSSIHACFQNDLISLDPHKEGKYRISRKPNLVPDFVPARSSSVQLPFKVDQHPLSAENSDDEIEHRRMFHEMQSRMDAKRLGSFVDTTATVHVRSSSPFDPLATVQFFAS